MATLETEAVVLRTLRYAEADAVLALFTRAAGRVSAIAKGARKPTSRLGGRLQPGVSVQASLYRGRGDMFTVRGASVLDARAGLWVEGWRLQAAGSVLEAVMRVMPEEEASEEAWFLLDRALRMLVGAAPAEGPARLHPLVLGSHAKLLVVSGLLPMLGACAMCGAPGPAAGFSARAGGVLCERCAHHGERCEPGGPAALAGLVAHPLAEAAQQVPAGDAAGVERLIGLVLSEHLGVRLRSAAPL
ncbi:MAG: DNA repair protein RecO [Miltoncostaeaceae bacterium]